MMGCEPLPVHWKKKLVCLFTLHTAGVVGGDSVLNPMSFLAKVVISVQNNHSRTHFAIFKLCIPAKLTTTWQHHEKPMHFCKLCRGSQQQTGRQFQNGNEDSSVSFGVNGVSLQAVYSLPSKENFKVSAQ